VTKKIFSLIVRILLQALLKKKKYTDINLLTISPIFLSYIFYATKKQDNK
jgi:hypothetical protein